MPVDKYDLLSLCFVSIYKMSKIVYKLVILRIYVDYALCGYQSTNLGLFLLL